MKVDSLFFPSHQLENGLHHHGFVTISCRHRRRKSSTSPLWWRHDCVHPRWWWQVPNLSCSKHNIIVCWTTIFLANSLWVWVFVVAILFLPWHLWSPEVSALTPCHYSHQVLEADSLMPSCTRFQSNNNPFILCPPPLSWSSPQLLSRVPSLPCLTVLTPHMVHTCSPARVCVSTTRHCNWVGDKSFSLSVSLCLYVSICVCVSPTLSISRSI